MSPRTLLLLAVLPLVGCSKPTTTPIADPEPPTTLPLGTQIQVLATGSGKEAKKGRKVYLHYVGTLEDGTVFDSTRKRGTPFAFRLGGGGVIRGWEEGIPGMREGEQRKLIIPPALGYGPMGADPIPPNATLTFVVDLIEVN